MVKINVSSQAISRPENFDAKAARKGNPLQVGGFNVPLDVGQGAFSCTDFANIRPPFLACKFDKAVTFGHH